MNETGAHNIDQDLLLAVISTTLLILLLISGVTIAFFLMGRQRVRQQIQIAETKLAFEKELRKAETEISEAMLSHFAQELHDNIGQMLTALHIRLENLKIDHPLMESSLDAADNYLKEIHDQLRLMSRTLSNEFISKLGLGSAIELECERIQELRKFNVHYKKGSRSAALENNQELMVFRIFQEILQNALRHSLAKNLHVELDANPTDFTLSIKDDGKGFDLEGILNSGKANGLLNIMKRARLAGLELEVKTSPGLGSLFILKKSGTLA